MLNQVSFKIRLNSRPISNYLYTTKFNSFTSWKNLPSFGYKFQKVSICDIFCITV